MVTITLAEGYFINGADSLYFSDLPNGERYIRSGDQFRVDYDAGYFEDFRGTGLGYSSNGLPSSGTIQSYYVGSDGTVGVRIEGLNLAAADLAAVASTGDGADDLALAIRILQGNDRINASTFDDRLQGFDGDDVLFGGGGNDRIEGGSGIDTALFAGARKQYAVSGGGTSHSVSSSAEGSDTLTGVERIAFLDGRLVYDNADPAAVTLRIYDATFGRAPDIQGLNFWISALQSGTSATSMASAFAGSPEFAATYGNLSNQGFVEQLYRNVLGREGDAGGVSYWTGQLNGAALARGEVLLGFSESAEHVAKLQPVMNAGLWDLDETAAQAGRVYSAAFDRAPDAGGLAFWTNALKSGGLTPAAMTDGFVQSAEFSGRYGVLNNEQFVNQLYLNVLDRAGDAGGTAFWTNALNSGASDRGDVLLGFSESAENVAKTLPTMTDGILLA